MYATKQTSQCSWKHYLHGRQKNFSLFKIPRQIVKNCAIADRTKRRVRLRLSDGRVLEGYLTISSDEEIRIPNWVQRILPSLDWFEVEFIGMETTHTGYLKWGEIPEQEGDIV